MSSFQNEASKGIYKGADYLKNASTDTMEQGKKELKKSGKDWMEYVQDHPIQSMFFGVVAFFALKGFIKD